jgi:hypothetical protein
VGPRVIAKNPKFLAPSSLDGPAVVLVLLFSELLRRAAFDLAPSWHREITTDATLSEATRGTAEEYSSEFLRMDFGRETGRDTMSMLSEGRGSSN